MHSLSLALQRPGQFVAPLDISDWRQSSYPLDAPEATLKNSKRGHISTFDKWFLEMSNVEM
jgi:hypothetical protein